MIQYNTRSKDNVRKQEPISGRKAFSNRNWGLWTSTNFASNEWNDLDKSLFREPESLDKYKRAIRNVTI